MKAMGVEGISEFRQHNTIVGTRERCDPIPSDEMAKNWGDNIDDYDGYMRSNLRDGAVVVTAADKARANALAMPDDPSVSVPDGTTFVTPYEQQVLKYRESQKALNSL